MSTTSDAILKIKANKALLSKVKKFKFRGLSIAKAGAKYNEEFLTSKFSMSTKNKLKHKINTDQRNQLIGNIGYYMLTLISIIFLYTYYTKL